MTEPGGPTSADQGPDPADSPLDAVDEAILGQLREAYDLADPPPAELDDRARFAIRLENVEFEVSRLYEDTLLGAGARAAERIRTITFESEGMTIMVTVFDPGARQLRVEGWLAPAAQLQVELRVADTPGDRRGRSHNAVADQYGRFVFHDVPAGLAQLAVHRAPGAAVLVTAPVLL